jgi:hypothetical protein
VRAIQGMSTDQTDEKYRTALLIVLRRFAGLLPQQQLVWTNLVKCMQEKRKHARLYAEAPRSYQKKPVPAHPAKWV